MIPTSGGRLWIAAWVTLLAALAPQRGQADQSTQPPRPAPAGHGADQSYPPEPHHFVLGAKGSYLAGFSDGQVHHFGGGGLFLELSVVPHWLELEYGIRVMTDGHAVAFPMDLLLKMPFVVSDVVHPFVGLGPTLVPVANGGINTHVGGVVSAGTYLWAWTWGGFVVEANYNLIAEAHLVHEVGGNGGFAFRW